MNPSRVWFLSLLVAGSAVVAVGCHDLELAQLRCSLNGTCPPGYVCGGDGFCRRQLGDSGRVAGPPGSKKQGEACGAADECITHNCADGVCCDTACGDACSACNLPENVGSCVAIARGQPSVHGGCAQQPATSCGTTGLCDGAGQCQLYDDTTICGDASCEKGSNTFFPEARCDGRGSCAAAAAGLPCAPFMCKPDGKACADRCGGATDCVLPNLCSNGSCGAIGNGLPCRNAGQCQSGFCVDGVCCNSTLHGTVHGMRSDRVAGNLRAGQWRETRTARAAPAPGRERPAPDSARPPAPPRAATRAARASAGAPPAPTAPRAPRRQPQPAATAPGRAARASPPRVASTCARRAASAPPPARATSIARPATSARAAPARRRAPPRRPAPPPVSAPEG